MYKDIITSIFCHIIIFIFFAISNLFFLKKIDLSQINISLIDPSTLKTSGFTPLKLNKNELQTKENLTSNNEINTDLKTNVGKGDNLDTKENLILKDNTNDIEKIIVAKELSKSAYKDNIVTQTKKIESELQNPSNNEEMLKEQQTRDSFINKIISGLDKGSLSYQELIALNNQIKGCWYGQGGYSPNEDLKVELLLTMNPDATINSIEVLNEETYNTPIRKTFLEQVLRALKDPKCRQLRLPVGSYNNWKIIHIIFDPKG